MFWSDSGANTLWKNVFFLGTKFSRHPEGLSFTGLRFSGKYRFSFRKVQISISQSTDFHFAKYRFPFRKVQIFISQSTDFRFAKYRFSFRKVQIFVSQSTDFHFAKYRFHFVSFRFAKYNKPIIDLDVAFYMQLMWQFDSAHVKCDV